jgi:dihydroxyacid dehydratase/phosphogluconate dehydratase
MFGQATVLYSAPIHAVCTVLCRLQWYDANVSLPGCDKNMPGSVIAMARLNRPSIMVYGGTIKPGHSVMDGSVLDIVSAFQSYGTYQKCSSTQAAEAADSNRKQ